MGKQLEKIKTNARVSATISAFVEANCVVANGAEARKVNLHAAHVRYCKNIRR